ncbi:MAG: SgcJ/EcaC family oxidoreductase [Holophagales bacterium]|nr:SgcJ/EcaC family oxidoreductase [Holophagales bacterium]
MTTLLRIDASARIEGSCSRSLADHFQSRWQQLHPDGEVVRRDLAVEPVPHLSDETIQAFFGPSSGSSGLELSEALARELTGADHLLIASPLYNLSLPSTLKAYIDHVVRSGITFETGEDGYRGLLKGTTATLVTARGGPGAPGDGADFQTGYLKAILAFVGIERVDVIAVDSTAFGEAAREEGLCRARRQVDQRFEEAAAPLWRGPLDEDDKRQIAALRQAQAAAILDGDAEAYADLCTDDIQLLIPGKDLISGRDAFLDAERALFARACFSRFEKLPLRVEREGEMAVEIGRQEATTNLENGAGGVFSARQKYTHILRRTPAGWRFAVLMSNPCE